MDFDGFRWIFMDFTDFRSVEDLPDNRKICFGEIFHENIFFHASKNTFPVSNIVVPRV